MAYGLAADRGDELRWRYADSFSLQEVFQTRIMLESQIAVSVALAGASEALEALVEMTDAMQRGWEEGDLVANVEADLQFHQTIVAHCGNRMLQTLYYNVADLLTETQRQPIPRTNTRRMVESVGEHRALIAALRARDPDAARAAMTAHIRNTALYAGVSLPS